MVTDIRIADYDYPLPEERIALHPLADRDRCKLLVMEGHMEGLFAEKARNASGDFSEIPLHTRNASGDFGEIPLHTRNASGDFGEIPLHVEDRIFRELTELLRPGTLLVANNTKVINARVEFFRESGARIEIFLLEPSSPNDYQLAFSAKGECEWTALIGNNKKWKETQLRKTVQLSDGQELTLTAERAGEEVNSDNSRRVRLSWTPADLSFAEVISAAGFIPIPPYLNREAEETDSDDYQTVYSRFNGSVAAPTAGLHFTPELLQELDRKGFERQYVTLHVGAGTFRPVKSETIGEHPMHTETFRVTLPLLDSLIRALEENRSVAAVGTTTVRTLESLPYLAIALREKGEPHVGQWDAYQQCTMHNAQSTIGLLKELREYIIGTGENGLDASTAIMIAPGFRWQIVDTLITNFHQPQSTLLLLVDSFLRGTRDEVRGARNEEGGTRDKGRPERESSSRLDCGPTEGRTYRPLWRDLYNHALKNGYRFLSYGDACLFFREK